MSTSNKEYMAADLCGPYGGVASVATPGKGTSITAVAVTAVSSNTDLSDANHFGWSGYQDRFCRIVCDQACFYYWSDGAADTVSGAAVDGTNRQTQGDLLPSNYPREELPTGRYLVVQAAAPGTFRVSITNRTKGS